MFISTAYAAAETAAEAPSATSAFMTQAGFILILMGLFYVILIMPQSRRIKEHQKMLGALQKGDKVVTAGGLVGKVSKIIDEDELEIDLGDTKVTALRSMISAKVEKEDTKKKDAK